MAIGVTIDVKGGTLAQYDQAAQKMGYRPGGPMGWPGSLFHWVTKTADGIRVTDVWETREQFDRFAQEKMGPITQEVGLGAPELQFFEVHNYQTAGPKG
jgi:hypothetical protein